MVSLMIVGVVDQYVEYHSPEELLQIGIERFFATNQTTDVCEKNVAILGRNYTLAFPAIPSKQRARADIRDASVMPSIESLSIKSLNK